MGCARHAFQWRRTIMKFYQKLLAATALVALMSGAASAKTFVYCSPASPEGFDPAAYTGGDTFDASAHPVYNRLAEFENGTTKVVPGLAESWDVTDDGLRSEERRVGKEWRTRRWTEQ